MSIPKEFMEIGDYQVLRMIKARPKITQEGSGGYASSNSTSQSA